MKHTMKKTPKTPNQPATFTHQDRARLRAAFAAGVHHTATGIAEDIQSSAIHNWDKLTDSEVQLIAASGVLIARLSIPSRSVGEMPDARW